MMMNRPLPPADLLNDPAFSPDPTLHPAHVSSHTVLTVPPGHPRFRQDRLATLAAAASRPPLPPIAVSQYSRRNDWDTDPFSESLPLQPPNTPQADGPVFQKQYTLRSDALMHEAVPSHRPPQMIQQLHESPASPSSSSSHMSTPSTTPPSSASSHYPNPIKNDPTMMPTTTSELPSATNVPPVIPPTKADKRSRTFSFFRRKQPQPPQPAQPQPRSPTKAKLTKAAPSKPIPTQSDLPRSASPPQPGRVQSAPEFDPQPLLHQYRILHLHNLPQLSLNLFNSLALIASMSSTKRIPLAPAFITEALMRP
ncbi:hypothetical protein ONZ45_g14126 [Pleurotus djamor]|nr:hypothetical protein ONZ45_g14126 [Pleurotus djamor]